MDLQDGWYTSYGGQRMRLIDVDELKKQIAGMAIKNHYSAKRANALCKLLDEQPTAFDVDKAIEQIKNYAIEFETFGISSDYVELDHVIEIVRGAGINVDTKGKS